MSGSIDPTGQARLIRPGPQPESAAHKAWVKAHPEARREAQRRWRQKRPGYMASWRAAHPGYSALTSRQYRRQRVIERIKARLWARHLQRLDGVTLHPKEHPYRGDSWALD